MANDPNGARTLYADNHYSCPELLATLYEEMNILGAGTCRKSRKRFPGDDSRLVVPSQSQ
eukprot:13583207-Ditylum_brightwellii.AAC.1